MVYINTERESNPYHPICLIAMLLYNIFFCLQCKKKNIKSQSGANNFINYKGTNIILEIKVQANPARVKSKLRMIWRVNVQKKEKLKVFGGVIMGKP